MNIPCTISETYPCVVGESLATGLAAMLLRFAGCNLACSYCDTRYACDQPGSQATVGELVETVLRSGLDLVLITGGEPLLQPDAVRALCAQLLSRGHGVLVETNGSLHTNTVPRNVVKILDVKTPGARAAVPFLEANLDHLTDHDQLKFVITSRDDYLWALKFLRSRTLLIDPGNVLFSAASPLLEPAALAQWLLEERLPYRFQLQLHKTLGLR